LIWKTLYVRADFFITLTEETKKLLIKDFRICAEKISVVRNPIIDDSINVQANEEIEEDWFYKNGNPIFIGIGRLTRQKDFSTLIKAFDIVRKKYDSRLLILGEGEERKELEALIRERGLSELILMPGFVKNPFKYLKRASCFVLSSRWEEPGHVLVEAAFLKVPIVSTRCPRGPEEFLDYGKGGLLCSVGNHEEMAVKMIYILEKQHSKELMQMIEKAFENSLQYHVKFHTEQLIWILEQLSSSGSLEVHS
jgi:glycosyltransferase involved in cell wall biosynthesis